MKGWTYIKWCGLATLTEVGRGADLILIIIIMLVLICVKHWKYRVANIARNVAALSARHLLKTFHLLAIIIIVAVFFLIITVFTKIMSRHDSNPDFHTNHHHDQDDRPGHRSLEGCHGTFAAQLGRTPANTPVNFHFQF